MVSRGDTKVFVVSKGKRRLFAGSKASCNVKDQTLLALVKPSIPFNLQNMALHVVLFMWLVYT